MSDTSLTPPTGQAQATQADGIAILTNELTSWGFGQDAITWATQAIQSNQPVDAVLFNLRQQPFYQNSIFGQVAKARQSAGLAAMSESQILQYRDQLQGIAQQAGLPQGFITDSEVTSLLGQDVSMSEVDQRITQGYVAALKAPPDVRDQLQQYYGIDTGHLAAYYLDPQRALPILQQQFQAASIGAAATRTGFGAVDRATAEQLAQLGITEPQARTGFTDLAKQAQLFNALPGSGEQGISQQVQLAAEFAGNAADQQQIAARQEERKATFEGGYRYAETQGKGITGLGPAQRNG